MNGKVKKGDVKKGEVKEGPAAPAQLPPLGGAGPELEKFKKATYEAKAIALGEIEAQIAGLRALIAAGIEPALSPRLTDLLMRQITVRERIEAEAEAAAAAAGPVAVTPEYTVRDSTESACAPAGGAPGPGHNILNYGEERTVLVKIKNTGTDGTDCPFTVNMNDGATPPAVRATVRLAPGASTTLRQTSVQTVEILCDPPPAAAGRCKASYTISVNPKGA